MSQCCRTAERGSKTETHMHIDLPVFVTSARRYFKHFKLVLVFWQGHTTYYIFRHYNIECIDE